MVSLKGLKNQLRFQYLVKKICFENKYKIKLFLKKRKTEENARFLNKKEF